MDKIIVTTGGVFLLFFIYWFFFGKRQEEVQVKASESGATVIVDGGYKPQVVKIKANNPVDITFLRKDDNSCLEEIVFPDLKIKSYLPINKPTAVHIPAQASGVYPFHCAMNMYQGKLIVE